MARCKIYLGEKYFLGAYDTFQEAELLLQKVNQLISENKFEEWYKDYKIILRKRLN